ncbi:MAG TPA: YkgJ family cysteine cluster protein, partial [Allosphingosinicella sp.]|nr:YkgJ family cysteine cluster protein [Allosphingosinicella sp.]
EPMVSASPLRSKVAPAATVTAEVLRRQLRFACTSCGACCNRSPEVELSEAAALADVFVFRLMFRLYRLPRTFAGYLESREGSAESGEEYYESKRLLAAFAARKWATKRRYGGRAIEYTNYLTISALSLDAGTGACAALDGGRCAIYARRPLSCRAVPFHYSRPQALAERDLAAFVATPGYRCDTGEEAPVAIDGGRIVNPEAQQRVATR